MASVYKEKFIELHCLCALITQHTDVWALALALPSCLQSQLHAMPAGSSYTPRCLHGKAVERVVSTDLS